MGVSLLWAEGKAPGPPARLPAESAWLADLGVDTLARALAYDSRRSGVTLGLLAALAQDAALISYRQAILADFLACEELGDAVAELIPSLQELQLLGREKAVADENQLLTILRRLRELELYVEVLERLLGVLAACRERFCSAGLLALHRWLQEQANAPEFCRLKQALPQLRKSLHHPAAVTVGINLDDTGSPVAATLLSIEERPFGRRKGLLSRLLFGEADDSRPADLAPLHELSPRGTNPLLDPLFWDLERILRASCRPVAQALTSFAHLSGTRLGALADELAFYVGATRLFRRLRAAGLPLCRPRMLPKEERACRFRGLYSINLALRLLDHGPPPGMPARPIPSDVSLGPEGRCCVLTGPNLGGKTTFLQAVGLAHVLAQAGLLVPGIEAEISPVDAIYTHFPKEERMDRGTGRLGEEAQRLAAIFASATPYSLVLLNESLASTSPGEALYLGRDVLAALRLLGARAIYATHLHDLAENLHELDLRAPGEPPTVSLVAKIAAGQSEALGRTFRIEPGPPQGRSFAAEVASAFGISFAQLRQKLRERGLIPE